MFLSNNVIFDKEHKLSSFLNFTYNNLYFAHVNNVTLTQLQLVSLHIIKSRLLLESSLNLIIAFVDSYITKISSHYLQNTLCLATVMTLTQNT